jgi:hypothetical protein
VFPRGTANSGQPLVRPFLFLGVWADERFKMPTALPASQVRARIALIAGWQWASMSPTIPANVDLRESDTRQGRRLEYFTLGWNLIEAVVGIGAGLIAGSIALVGFGVDSIIESFSGASPLWRLQSHETGKTRAACS